MRILQAATTASPAPQSSTLNVSADDSFVGILNAVSEEQVSVHPAVGYAAKGEAGQDSASRGTSKQAEAQAPPVQSYRSFRELYPPAACVITGVRIQPTAAAATLAPQSLIQNAPADDSLAFILNAVSKQSASVPSVLESVANGLAGQVSASSEAGKQAEAQAPPTQDNKGSRAQSSRPACVAPGVRIQPAATTATRAPQSLVQNVPSGDSLVVRLKAVSKQPASVPSVLEYVTNGQVGQASASRRPGKRVEEQTPPVQVNEGSRASAVPSQDHRVKHVVDEISVDQGNIHLQAGQPSSVVVGENWSSTLYDSRLQTSKVSTVPSTTTFTTPIALPMIWSSHAFQAPIAGLSNLPSPGDMLISQGTQTQTDYRVVNGKASDQAVPQLAAIRESGNVIGVTAIASPIQVSVSDVVESPVPENDQSSKAGYSAAPAVAAKDQVSVVAHDQTQSQVSQPSSNTAAQDRTPPTQDLLASAATPNPTASTDLAAPVAQHALTDLAAGPVEFAAGVILEQSMALPIPAAIPNKQSGIELASSIPQKADSEATKSRNSDLAGPANSGSSKASGDAVGSNDISTHTSQGAQTDSSPGAMSTSRAQDIDASHSQAQPAGSQVVSHEAAIAPRIADTPADASQLSPRREVAPSIESDTVEATATSGISAAKLIQTMNESEMRVGLNSSAFGDISIRTSISNHQMLAQITLDHSELSQEISSHVSSAQAKLGDEYGLRASIEVNNLASPHSGESGHPSQREKGTPDGLLPAQTVSQPGEEGSSLSQEAIVGNGNDTRLDIRA